MQERPEYEQPEVRDYGDLVAITAAAGWVGSEDGTGKVLITSPSPPAGP